MRSINVILSATRLFVMRPLLPVTFLICPPRYLNALVNQRDEASAFAAAPFRWLRNLIEQL